MYVPAAIAFLLSSCSDWVAAPAPVSQLSSSSVYQDDATASAAMAGVYIQMMSSASYFASGGAGSITVLAGLSADELESQATATSGITFYNNALDRFNTDNARLWQQAYKTIYYANSVLEGLQKSQSVSQSVRGRLTGEALFLRAFCHFYLVNLYGDVPLVLSTDYQHNQTIARAATDSVYAQILSDLTVAKTALATDFSLDQGQRIRPNARAVAAFLARVYLYRKDWQKAADQASELIGAVSDFQLTAVDSVFLKNSKEAIWQLMPVSPVLNTYEGNTFVLNAAPTSISLHSGLAKQFLTTDLRNRWIGRVSAQNQLFYFPYKYKIRTGTPVQEYSMVLRLAEQYLIRAEAYAHQGQNQRAVQDLDHIRQRAGLVALEPEALQLTQEALLDSVYQQRRLELFCEWGHRWFDLKRTAHAGRKLTESKSIRWQDSAGLYPIPDSEIQLNSALIQNPGY